MEWAGRCARSCEAEDIPLRQAVPCRRGTGGDSDVLTMILLRCGETVAFAPLWSAWGWRISLGCECRKTHCLFPGFPFLKSCSLSSVLHSFLDDLYRIAHRGYKPTDEDIVCVRLQTVTDGGRAGISPAVIGMVSLQLLAIPLTPPQSPRSPSSLSSSISFLESYHPNDLCLESESEPFVGQLHRTFLSPLPPYLLPLHHLQYPYPRHALLQPGLFL